MPATVLYEEREPAAAAASEGDALWLTDDELRAVTGWELKPEGICRDDVCVPIPPGREGALVREGGRLLDLAALGRLLGQPIARDETHDVWVFGQPARARAEALASLRAPDFTLPDLEGRPHSLSDYRGHKVFLVSWASW